MATKMSVEFCSDALAAEAARLRAGVDPGMVLAGARPVAALLADSLDRVAAGIIEGLANFVPEGG